MARTLAVMRLAAVVAAGASADEEAPDAAPTPEASGVTAPEGATASEAPPAEAPAPPEPAPARASTGCATAVSRKVQAHYDGVRDLTARFTQSSEVVSLGGGAAAPASISGGEVSFSKPGRMRWSYEQPEPSLVVTDGEELWLYDPAAKEAQRVRTSRGFLSGAALQFLLGHGEMSRDFRIRALACTETEARLDLVPKREAAYERLEIRVDPATGEVKETAVFDLVGNVTRVAFADVRTNSGLAEDLFRFSPPEGVRVVEVPVSEP